MPDPINDPIMTPSSFRASANSVKCPTVIRKWEAYDFPDASPIDGERLQPFIHCRVKILLLAPNADPGRYVIHIDRSSLEMKSRPDQAMLDFAVTKLAPIDLFILLPHNA